MGDVLGAERAGGAVEWLAVGLEDVGIVPVDGTGVAYSV